MQEMKDSGIEWIGDIPYDWKCERAKYAFIQRSTKGNDKNLELLSPTQNYGVIPQTLYDKLSGMNSVKLAENSNLNLLKTIHCGDFCISLRSFQGGFEYSRYEGVVSPAYQVFYSKKIYNGYYRYLFKEKGFINKMNSYTMSLRDGKNISFQDFSNSLIPIPPIEIQKYIANYLDEKCSKIDSLTSNIQKQLLQLEEYKKSIITEAVTKGLDPNVEMKDSGIEWIGDIPKNWKINKIKNTVSIKGRIGFRGYTEKDLVDEYEGAITLSPSNIDLDIINYDKCSYLSWVKYYESPEIMINNNDIILVKTGSSFGKSCYIEKLPKEATLNPQLVVFKKVKINFMFLYYYMQTELFKSQCKLAVVGGTIPTLSQEKINNFFITEPSNLEQECIVNILNKKCKILNDCINSKKQQLSKLEEYKKSLIYECVTGKKDVDYYARNER